MHIKAASSLDHFEIFSSTRRRLTTLKHFPRGGRLNRKDGARIRLVCGKVVWLYEALTKLTIK